MSDIYTVSWQNTSITTMPNDHTRDWHKTARLVWKKHQPRVRSAIATYWVASSTSTIARLRNRESLLDEVFSGYGLVNHKRVERIWRREGLKVPRKQPKRGRLWLNDGSRIRLRPAYRNHVWCYDFMSDCTANGSAFRVLNVIDEFSRECLAVRVARHLTHDDVLDCLARLFWSRGVPAHICSDNGPEFTAKQVRVWLRRLQIQTLFIEPGSPWENGYVESFNGKMRDELLDREVFYTLKEAQVLIENWRCHYNTVRPHSALNYRPPAPEAILVQPLVPVCSSLT